VKKTSFFQCLAKYTRTTQKEASSVVANTYTFDICPPHRVAH